jgi:hypothetical protein
MEQNQILPVCIVAGNKCDLQGIRQIAARDGLEWSRQHNFGFMETSAREMVNIEETFARMLSGLSVQVPFTDLEQSSSAAWWKRERMQQLAYRKSSHSQLHEAALPRPVIAPSTRRDLRPWTLSRRNCLHRLNRSGTHHLSAGKSVHASLYDFRSWLDIPDWKSLLTYFLFLRVRAMLALEEPLDTRKDWIGRTLGIPCILEKVCVSRHHVGTWICNQWMYTCMLDLLC